MMAKSSVPPYPLRLGSSTTFRLAGRRTNATGGAGGPREISEWLSAVRSPTRGRYALIGRKRALAYLRGGPIVAGAGRGCREGATPSSLNRSSDCQVRFASVEPQDAT